MMPERDYLITKVFPLLKKYCAERDVTLFELDLRWGISEEEAKQGKVVDICLHEIENTHPFFIGLLGERYGWIPTKQELAASDALNNYVWLNADLSDGLSITEIEMQYGVLRAKEYINACFYFRSPEMPTPDEFREHPDSPEAQRLTRLKNTISAQKKYPVQTYLSVEDLGNRVKNDFIALVDKLFPQGALSALEKERLQQRAFLKSRTGTYIASQENYDALNQFIQSDEQFFVISGESGMGKSALIANWIEKYAKQCFSKLIYHFVGNSNAEGDYRKILQRFIDEIREIYGLTNNTSDKIYNQKKELTQLLFQITDKEPLLIVLDGINQLADIDNAKSMNWLPDFPQNVKIIFSTLLEDETMFVFKQRAYSIYELSPLIADYRRRLIKEYLLQYGKKLTENQEDIIVRTPQNENTLILTTLLEELRSHGKFENLDTIIDNYLLSPDFNEFFQRILVQKEKVYNVPKYPHWVEDVLCFIGLSKAGLSENEIITICNIPPLYWSQFYCAVSRHFTVLNGLINFSHQFIKIAVEERYLKDTATNECLRRRIVSCFENDKNSNNDRKNDECQYQFYMLGECDKLYESLINNMMPPDHDSELAHYWNLLYRTNKEAYPITAYLEKWKTKNVTADICSKHAANSDTSFSWAWNEIMKMMYFRLWYFCIIYLNDYQSAIRSIKCVLDILTEDDTEDMIKCLNGLGVCYIHLKQYEQSIEYSLKALEMAELIYGTDDIRTTVSLNNIGEAYNCLGEATKDRTYFLKALHYFEETSEIRLHNLNENHPDIAVAYSNMASVFQSLGDLQKSFGYRVKGLSAYLACHGKYHVDTAIEYHNIGAIALEMKKYDKAIEYMQQSLEIYDRILGKGSKQAIEELEALFVVYRESGDWENAIKYCQQTVELKEELEGKTKELSQNYSSLSVMYFQHKEYDKAILYMSKTIEILNNIEAGQSRQCGLSYDNMGKYYLEINDRDNSFKAYNMAIAIHKSIDEKGIDVANSLYYLAKAYYRFEQFEESCEYLKSAIDIMLVHKDDVREQLSCMYNNLGVIYYGMNKVEDAIIHLQKAHEINLEINGDDDIQTQQNYNMLQQLKQVSSAGIKSVQELNNTDAEGFPNNTEEEQQLNEILRYALEAYRKGQADRCIPLLLQVMKKSEDYYGEQCFPIQIEICEKLGSLYEKRLENNEAFEWYGKAIDYAYKVGDDECISRTYKTMAEFYWNMEDYQGAVKNYLQEILYHDFQPDIQSVRCYGNIAYALYKLHDDLEISLDFYSIAYDLAYEILGDEHEHTQSFVNGINMILSELDKYDDNNRFGINIVASLNRIVYFCYKTVGNDYVAIGFNNLALKYMQKNYPNKDTSGLLLNLAYLYMSNKKYKKALDILGSVLDKAEDNIDDRTVITMVGDCYFETFEYGKACFCYASCFDDRDDLVQQYPAQFRNYGAALLETGNYSEGLKILKQLFNTFYLQYNFAGMYYQYGRALILNGQTEDGIKWLSAELAPGNIEGKLCGMEDRNYDIEQSGKKVLFYRNYLYLAKGYHQKGDDKSAKECFRQALHLLNECQENDAIDKAFVLNEMANYYLDKHLLDEAFKLNKEAFESVIAFTDDPTPVIGHILKLRGYLLMKHDPEQAKDNYEQAYEIFKFFLGEDSPYTKQAVFQ
jgi:tetratricopeptide (TPR) repeat protein